MNDVNDGSSRQSDNQSNTQTSTESQKKPHQRSYKKNYKKSLRLKERTGAVVDTPNILVEAALSKMRLAYDVQRAHALLLWPDVVGTTLQRLTRAYKVEHGTLIVRAKDSLISHNLGMQRKDFLERLNAKLEEPLTDIRFIIGSVESPNQHTQNKPTTLPEPDETYTEQLMQKLPDHFSEEWRETAYTMAQTMSRVQQHRRERGWQTCIICEQFTPKSEQPCIDCQRNLEDPWVKKASQKLARQPERFADITSMLNASGRCVARHLALQKLEEQMQSLVLECIRSSEEGQYFPMLRAAATLYLSLKLHLPRHELHQEHCHELPEHAAQVLQTMSRQLEYKGNLLQP